jgi:prohibitin 1
MTNRFSTAAILIIVLILFLAVRTVRSVPAGHVGIVDFFGSVSEKTLPPGLNFVNPLARLHKMSIQSRETKQTMDTPSSEGLTVHLEVSLIFHLDPLKAVDVYKTVGLHYDSVLIDPNIRSVVREITSSFEAKSLYSADREKMSRAITEHIVASVEPRGVVVERLLLRDVGLPAKLQASIQEKLSAEQEASRMQFVLQKEKQEAERKRIEAEGISVFQKVVTEGISENLLRWKGIEATRDLASSPNAKVVIVGSGRDGLPLILGGDMTLQPPPAQPRQ